MKAFIQAKVSKCIENNSKNTDYNKEFPFLVNLVIPEIMDGEKVSIPHERVASKINIEKGETTLEVNVSGGKNYELRFNITGVLKDLKNKGL